MELSAVPATFAHLVSKDVVAVLKQGLAELVKRRAGPQLEREKPLLDLKLALLQASIATIETNPEDWNLELPFLGYQADLAFCIRMDLGLEGTVDLESKEDSRFMRACNLFGEVLQVRVKPQVIIWPLPAATKP